MRTPLAFAALLLASCASAPPAPAPPPPPATATPLATSAAPSAAPAKESTEDDAAVDALEQRYLDYVVATSPESATALGVHTRDAELDDRSAAAIADGAKRRAELLAAVRELRPRAKASRRARIDLEILESALEVEDNRWAEERPHERMPTLYTSPMDAIFLMMARDYAPAAERAKNVLARMEKIPALLATAKASLKEPPKVWTQVGIEVAGSAPSFFEAQKAPLLAALPGEKARVEADVAAAKKAYADYKAFLEKTVLPRSNGSFAAGKERFEFLLKRNYALNEGADEVLALGERILAQTEAQMTEVAKRIDPSAKGWPEVTARLKKKHPTADDLIPSYKRELKRARDFLVQKDAVAFPPGDDCEVIETPVFLRNTVTAAYDQPPPLDKVTRGFFFVTPVDRALPKAKQEEMLRENDNADEVNTAVHEAYPGHHLQLSFARRHPSLVRKMNDAAIFSEGWGLYSEELMAELGYYSDEERLMQLEWTLVRAARVVIDVGLHTRGMTFEDAIKILTDKVHLEPTLALSEVKRYTMTPTQPLSYLVGREAIFKLRDRYKDREGARYSLRGFHEEVLSHGTIPPGLIAREIFGDGARD